MADALALEMAVNSLTDEEIESAFVGWLYYA
jgi:hypothetical protein